MFSGADALLLRPPIGKRFRLDDENGPWVEVVGVAQTTWYGFIGEARQSFFYLPFLQNPRANCTLLVETSSAEAPPWIVPLRDWFVLLTRASPCLMSAACTLSINTRACKHCV